MSNLDVTKDDFLDATPARIKVKLSSIIFDEGLYPRKKGHDPATVQIYARDIEQIEQAGKFISINDDNKLLDGRHRMLAYKKNADGADVDVQVWKYPITTDLASLALAFKLQDRGRALTDDDRQSGARRLYNLGMRQKDIAAEVGVSAATISKWLSETIVESPA